MIVDREPSKVDAIASILSERFGDNAITVAETQFSGAEGLMAELWRDVVTHLSARPGDPSAGAATPIS